MAKPKAPAYAKRIEALKKKLSELVSRDPRRPFAKPMTEAELAAFEKRAGAALPAEVRAFYTEVTAGELPPTARGVDAPPLLSLEQGLSAASVHPAKPFPISEAQTAELLDRQQKLKRGEPTPAADGPFEGALPVRDQSESLECVVLSGAQQGKMWSHWDAGWTPMLTVKKGKASQTDFLGWAEGFFDEALAAAPPPIAPDAKALNLFNLALSDVPPALRAATKIEKLSLVGNAIAELPAWMGELTELTELRLGGNPLTALPESLAALDKLKVLDLSSTKIPALPPWIGRLKSLAQLVCTRGALESLPAEIGDLAELEVLNASMNKLARLPDTLGRLAKLRELDVSKNALTELPAGLGGLASLRVFRLANNPLRALPEELSRLPVESLDLEGMPELDWERAIAIAAKMPALSVLRINQPMPALPKAISELGALKTLRLVGIGLTEVPPEVTSLPAIEVLSLDQNQLTTLPDAIGTMPALKTVVLFANPISKDEVARLRAKWPHLKIEHF